MSTRKARVSLCMIVKDEEDHLDACLESARPYVDEICVVDTGSTDRTVAIAEAHGARVKHIAWPDDFAEARNHSLAMATGDWILVLDADEQLRPGQEAELAACVDHPKLVAAFQRIINHGDEGRQVSCLIMRLFRNRPEHRFRGAIHEQIIPPVLETARIDGLRVLDECLDIDHYGYTEALRVSKDKDRRNRFHFERALEKEPEDAYVWFKYGDFLRRFDDQGPAIEALGRACELIRAMPDQEVHELTYCAEPFALRALELVRQRRFDEAEADLEAARRLRETPMIHWTRGHFLLEVGRYQEAYDSFAACHALDGKSVHVPAQPGITSGRSVFGMARALLGLGRQDEAIARFESGYASYPDCADLMKACARIRILRRQHKDALGLCMDWLQRNPEDAEVWQIGSEILMELGVWERAEEWIARASSFAGHEEVAAITAIRGECRLGNGAIEEALDLFHAALDSQQGRAGFALVLSMLGEALPATITARPAELRAAVAAAIRRLAQAPEAERMLELLAAGMPADSPLADLVPAPLGLGA
ncbi:MAG: glycosyltransferase [Planctomycetes bacterium]|nr:glycosyltransferase [Planctomycetota bacterium]